MPYEDPIIDEIHRYRREHAAKFNYDIDAIFADMMARQKELEAQGWEFVDPPVRQPSAPPMSIATPTDATHSGPTPAS